MAGYTFNHGNALDDFYVDLLYVVVVFAMQKSAWSLLPQHSGITVDVWRSYLDRREAVKILWQSQELLCTHGVLRGNNAIVELPTGVGKTKSIELIIRAAQLSNRAREVIIVAPLRALCNEITHDLQCAFRKDDVEINRFSDVLEDDYSFDLLSNDSIRISICTPEKLNYIIHAGIFCYSFLFFCDIRRRIRIHSAHNQQGRQEAKISWESENVPEMLAENRGLMQAALPRQERKRS